MDMDRGRMQDSAARERVAMGQDACDWTDETELTVFSRKRPSACSAVLCQ